MLIRFKDLKSLAAVAADDSTHAVEDLFVGPDHAVTHVVVRLGTWFDSTQCALRVAGFGQPDIDESSWPLAMSQADVDTAGVDGPGEVALRTEQTEVAEPDMLPAGECRLVEAQDNADLHRLGKLLGAEIMATDKLAGSLMDVIVETEGWKIAMLIVHAGPTDTEHQRVIPVGMVAGIDWDAPRIDLTCPEATVDSSPDLHEISDRIEGHWFNKVLAYYGLG